MTTRGTEDPRVVRSRAQILDAAVQVFLEHGFQAATVDEVAHAAQVAKRTVYNLYADKEALFRAAVLSAIGIAEAFAASLASDIHSVQDPAVDLPALGADLAELTLLGPAPALRKLVASESHRFPDLAAEYRRRAPEAVMRALADLFTELSGTGSLRIEDAQLASEHFAFLVMGADLDRAMFARPTFVREHVRRRATAGVVVFLDAYAP